MAHTADYGEGATSPAPGAYVHGPQLKDALRRSDRPGVDSFVFPDAEAIALVRFRLGLSVGGGRCGRVSSDPTAKPPNKRCTCADATARHRVTCPFGPWAIWRHNRLARLLQELVLEIPGATVRWTPRTAFWRSCSEAARRIP